MLVGAYTFLIGCAESAFLLPKKIKQFRVFAPSRKAATVVLHISFQTIAISKEIDSVGISLLLLCPRHDEAKLIVNM